MSASYEQTWTINPDEHFPDLSTVAVLYPGANPERPTLDAYTSALELHGRLTPVVEDAIAKARAIGSETDAIFYIAGGLTGVSEELKERYGKVSELLASYSPADIGKSKAFFGYVPHLHGTDPVKHPHITAREVRDIDYIWGRIMPAFTVNFTFPTAHGNAIEEGWEEAAMVPGIYVNQQGNRLSRLTLGMNNIMSQIEYDDFYTDGLAALKLTFDEIHAWMQVFPNKDPREFYYLNYHNLRIPLLSLNGLAPGGFHPVIPVSHTMVYISDPESPHYGKAGDILWHDWKEYGNIAVQFSDGSTTVVSDESDGVKYWRK